MAMEINVELITREAIKPSSPTPHHHRNFNLCRQDQLASIAYGPLVLFYSFNGNANDHHLTVADKSQRLKRSLAETLTRFYPLAGQTKGDAFIEGNDFGAVFVEAKVTCLLKKFLEKPDAELIRKLVPVQIESPEAKTASLVHVQVNFFACGSLAIGLGISHKVADRVTFISAFIKAWAAAAALGSADAVQLPSFNASSIFPPQNLSFTEPDIKLNKDKCITKRLVFDASKIAALKAKATSESVACPTRVEAVTALIWKCAMNASRSNTDYLRYSILSQSVNIRKHTVPSSPENTIGSLVGYSASCATECDQIELQSLVGQLRKGLLDFGENYADKLPLDPASKIICQSFEEAASVTQLQGDVDFYISTNFCTFPFYGIDFGWGKPTWVTIPSGDYKNVTAIMDTRDGNGIEAWVTLTEDDMAFFERDQELLSAAYVDPSALNLIMSMSCL